MTRQIVSLWNIEEHLQFVKLNVQFEKVPESSMGLGAGKYPTMLGGI